MVTGNIALKNGSQRRSGKTFYLLTPKTIINGRLQGFGDYETPEQNIPVKRPAYKWWELCMTINNNWGYQPADTNWKSPYEIITIFADVVSNGGNLLLDIGPREDGSIPVQELYVLKELGEWNKLNGKAILEPYQDCLQDTILALLHCRRILPVIPVCRRKF
jgi:hypothetical protein